MGRYQLSEKESKFIVFLFIFGMIGGLLNHWGSSMFRKRRLIAALSKEWLPTIIKQIQWNFAGTLIGLGLQFFFVILIWFLGMYIAKLLGSRIKQLRFIGYSIFILYGLYHFLDGLWRIFFIAISY